MMTLSQNVQLNDTLTFLALCDLACVEFNYSHLYTNSINSVFIAYWSIRGAHGCRDLSASS